MRNIMKVVLIRPNYNSHIITPPLGLGYLSSCLRRQGIETVIIDGLKDNLSADVLLEKILFQKPDAVGITCLTAFYNEVVYLIFESPQYKVRIGDFTDREEAIRFCNLLRKESYPDAWVVKSNVNVYR